MLGEETARYARARLSLQLYRAGGEHAASCGITIVADTSSSNSVRRDGGASSPIDECPTPDSSCFYRRITPLAKALRPVSTSKSSVII